MGIVKRYTAEEVTRLSLLVTGYMMGGGLCCELVLGSFRPWSDEYRFSGLTWPAFTCWNLSLFVLAILAVTRRVANGSTSRSRPWQPCWHY